MNSPYPRAVGSYVEAEIGHLKNNLITKHLRIDDFVKSYLELCDGAVKQASSNEITEMVSDINLVQEPASTLQEALENPSHPEPKAPQQITPCPVCSNGDLPGGAHTCIYCNKAVHVLEFCSKPVNGEEEGYGQKRVCLQCYNEEITNTTAKTVSVRYKKIDSPVRTNKFRSKITNFTAKKISDSSKLTSIRDRTDVTTAAVNPSKEREATSVEGWKGLSLPPKKRPAGYYWRANPDFSILTSETTSTKLKVLKNGVNPTLKLVKIGKSCITLSNTCSFDAPCQVFATAYCDSIAYRNFTDRVDIENSMLDVAKCVATKGVRAITYKKRASLLAKTLSKDVLRGGVVKINCAMDSSSLLRQIRIHPTVTETYTCSSPYCPSPKTQREVRVISSVMEKTTADILGELEECLSKGDAEERSSCMLTITHVRSVPQDYYINDADVSSKGPVCAGIKNRESKVGPHLIIEVVCLEERVHNQGSEIGVGCQIKTNLNAIPRTVKFKNKNFTLRGLVGFTPPLRDCDIGHYRGYAIRTDLTWEIYDDLRDKVIIVDGTVEVNVHIIIYTV